MASLVMEDLQAVAADGGRHMTPEPKQPNGGVIRYRVDRLDARVERLENQEWSVLANKVANLETRMMANDKAARERHHDLKDSIDKRFAETDEDVGGLRKRLAQAAIAFGGGSILYAASTIALIGKFGE